MAEKITAWSASRYNTYKQCPGKARILYILKLKEPSSPALDNGLRKHTDMEHYLKGYTDLPSHVNDRIHDFCKTLREAKPHAELQVAFNNAWKTVEWFSKAAWARIKIDYLQFDGKRVRIGDWKGLAIDTQIPTPGGFKTMGQLSVGDTVFDKDGKLCSVVGKSQVKELPLYEIQFKDGAKVICDEEHLWLMQTGEVKATPTIDKGESIPMSLPVDMPTANLPIHPYVLGLWLGDGRRRDGSIGKPDDFIFAEIERLGYQVGKNIGSEICQVRTIHGLRGQLAQLNLLDNKHIPQLYLRASISQRLELLRGLLDSDGYANPTRQEAVFSSTDKAILRGTRELLASLGIRFRSNTGVARGFGVECIATQIAFRPPFGINPFKLPRKASVAAAWTRDMENFRRVQSVTPIGIGKSQCISVDSPSKTYLCTNRFVVTHNTGKIRDGEYDEQLELYALTGLLMFPAAEEVYTELVFIEQGVVLPPVTYTRDDLPRLMALWNDRTGVMLNDEVFEYTPNQYCGYCHFRIENGGPCTAA